MWNSFFYSLPVQLLSHLIRKNMVLLIGWVLLMMIVMGGLGKVLGIPYLFLDPAYLNRTTWVGFFLMGVGFAIYTVSFHMTCYIVNGARFRFLAVVRNPFLHFCLNNSIVPVAFYLLYIYSVVKFQLGNELDNPMVILGFLVGFLGGTSITYYGLFLYFKFTNKDFFVLFADTMDKKLRKTRLPRFNIFQRYRKRKKVKTLVTSFLGIDGKVKYPRPDINRFGQRQLLKVFDQNHLNLFLIQLVLILFILFLNFFREYQLLQFPAAMSFTLLLSILTMLLGAAVFWLRSWALPIVLLIFLLVNFFSKTELFNRPHAAFGLNYDNTPATYDLNTLNQQLHPDTIKKDMENTLVILENWRQKFPEDYKPKLVMIATSGGGQRAALWVLKVLQEAHRATEGKLFEHTRLITGASGGVIGAAFFRELYLRSLRDSSIQVADNQYLEQISSDNLNPIIFTLLVNDLLIRSQYFEYNGRRYLKDRGYAFENQLNLNTGGILDKPLIDYLLPEREALIPMLPVSPLVINDARKLIVSPHSMSYMAISGLGIKQHEKSRTIDFIRFFREQDAGSLRFISALRMGATFPFITPNIDLPTEPRMSTMDAGLSDNFGIEDALKFAFVFQDWIKKNTSGVLLLTIRDSEKITEIQKKPIPSLMQKIITPIKNIYVNWDNVQTLDNESIYYYMKATFPFDLDRVEFEYSTESYARQVLPDQASEPRVQEESDVQKASLNWRLTASEKTSIINSILTPFNQHSLHRLDSLFSTTD